MKTKRLCNSKFYAILIYKSLTLSYDCCVSQPWAYFVVITPQKKKIHCCKLECWRSPEHFIIHFQTAALCDAYCYYVQISVIVQKSVALCPELIILPRLLFFLLETVYFKINNYEPIDKMQQFQLKFRQVSWYSSNLVFHTHYLTICVKYHIYLSTHSMAHMQYGYKVRIKETGHTWMEFWMVLILKRKDSIGT